MMNNNFKNMINNMTEQEILNDNNLLSILQNLFSLRNFSEDFLIKTLDYYDSDKCLRTQKNLTPYFCFKYLCDKNSDSSDIYTDYNDIVDYFKNSNYSIEYIKKVYNQVMNE